VKLKPTPVVALLFLLVSACSSADAIKFANVQGTVTHMGAPLADAQVTFIPEHGPVAFAMTDLSGKYSIAGSRGVATGKVRAAVKIAGQDSDGSMQLAPELASQPKTPQEAQNYIKKAGEMQKQLNEKQATKKSKGSPIPKRYASVDTSNLEFTIKPNETNTIDIALKE
jgi:hypothetical protein